MLDHEELKALAQNPALIDSEEDLHALLQHIDTCKECSKELNESVALVEAALEPLSQIGLHLSSFKLGLLRVRGFEPNRRPARNLAEWHLMFCSECRSRYRGFRFWIVMPFAPRWRWVSVTFLLIIVGALLRPMRSPTGEDVYRIEARLTLLQPADGATVTSRQEFKWTDVSASDYKLEIREEHSHRKVLEQKLLHNFYILGPPTSELLRDNNAYAWDVTAVVGSKVYTSESHRFTFHRPNATPISQEFLKNLRALALTEEPAKLPGIVGQLKGLLPSAPSDADAARIHGSIGDALLRSNDPETAIGEYTTALDIWRELGSPDPYEEGRALTNFGLASQRIGALSAALSAYRKAHAVVSRFTDSNFEKLRSNCALNEGTLERRLGDYQPAKEHYEEALELDRRLIANGVIKDETRIADELTNIGNLLVDELEDPQSGLVYLQQAEDIHLENEKHNHRPDENAGDTEDGLAIAYEILNEYPRAVQHFRKSLWLTQHSIPDSNAINQTLNNLAGLYLEQGKYKESLPYLRQAVKLKSKVSADELWRTEEELAKYYLGTKQSHLAHEHIVAAINLVQQSSSRLPESKRYVYLAQHLQPFFDLAIFQIAEGNTNGAFTCLENARAATLSIANGDGCDSNRNAIPPWLPLPPGVAALAYFVGDSIDPVLCFAIEGEHINVYQLKNSKEIGREVKDYESKLGSIGESKAREQLESDLLPPAVIKSLLAHQIHRLLVTPDASLNSLSFEALSVPGSPSDASRRLIDYAAIEVVPSVRWWTVQQVDTASHPNDAFIATTSNNNMCPTDIRLNWAEAEATEVGKLASLHTSHVTGIRARDNLLNGAVSNYRILHFAVHGQAAHNAEGSHLLLDCSTNDVLTGDLITKAHLSGQLIVLSACESAVGRIANGEGIDSLADVFLRSGASCVLATRSRVSDENAYRVMTSFYRELSHQVPIDVALQHVQQRMESQQPLKDWSAFSVFGRCDSVVPITPTLMRRLQDMF